MFSKSIYRENFTMSNCVLRNDGKVSFGDEEPGSQMRAQESIVGSGRRLGLTLDSRES